MITLGEIAIMGGGCYGRFYLEQLHRAWHRDAVRWERLRVVDHDPGCAAAALLPGAPATELACTTWAAFLGAWLDPAMRGPADRLVPTPLMPHLFADWLTDRARQRWPGHTARRLPIETPIGTPFDMLHPGDGNRYVSHADWLCPMHCIEPADCPKIRAPRSWEMHETLAAWNAHRDGGPAALAMFVCRHVVHGVGMVDATTILRAAEDLDRRLEADGEAEMLIGSVSSCHGAVGLLRMEPT
ncbi:MAG TPA: hypothetical protein VFN22_05735 [Gemmatimonadales bacterium]|nr:hypothetical protein [Gemmatimonadales bacterium]